MIDCIPAGKRTIELLDVDIAEDAPEPVSRNVLGAEQARVVEEEPDVAQFGAEPIEVPGKRSLVVR